MVELRIGQGRVGHVRSQKLVTGKTKKPGDHLKRHHLNCLRKLVPCFYQNRFVYIMDFFATLNQCG